MRRQKEQILFLFVKTPMLNPKGKNLRKASAISSTAAKLKYGLKYPIEIQ